MNQCRTEHNKPFEQNVNNFSIFNSFPWNSLKFTSTEEQSTSHWKKGPHDHCKNIKSIFSRLKVTYNTKCSETLQMSCCLSKQHVQQIRVTVNNTDSTSREIVGLQNVDSLNCTKTVLFSLKNKKRMPVNARSLPEFNVCPNDVTFSYKKKTKNTSIF